MINEEMLLERLIQALKAHGHSITSQRVMIFRALARHRDHPTAEALYEELQREHAPDLSLATVYKNLHVFEEIGLARAVASPDGRARFDVPLAPHHHLFCTRCGAMVDIEEGVHVEIGPHLEEETGFRVTGLELLLQGVCASCQSKQNKPRLWRQTSRAAKGSA
ncbi:MAG: Fur family transcriptional regulator [Thermoanaerobaculum sp.]